MGKTYAPPPTTPPVAAPPPAGQPAAPIATNARWNLLISMVLLAWGLFNVISGFFEYPQLASLLQQYYTSNKIGTLSDAGLAHTLGVAITISNVVIYLVVLYGTYRRLRSGRPAAWIPFIGGVLSLIVIVSCVFAVVYNDSTFLAYVSKNS
jgi:hypothetical protein